MYLKILGFIAALLLPPFTSSIFAQGWGDIHADVLDQPGVFGPGGWPSVANYSRTPVKLEKANENCMYLNNAQGSNPEKFNELYNINAHITTYTEGKHSAFSNCSRTGRKKYYAYKLSYYVDGAGWIADDALLTLRCTTNKREYEATGGGRTHKCYWDWEKQPNAYIVYKHNSHNDSIKHHVAFIDK